MPVKKGKRPRGRQPQPSLFPDIAHLVLEKMGKNRSLANGFLWDYNRAGIALTIGDKTVDPAWIAEQEGFKEAAESAIRAYLSYEHNVTASSDEEEDAFFRNLRRSDYRDCEPGDKTFVWSERAFIKNIHANYGMLIARRLQQRDAPFFRKISEQIDIKKGARFEKNNSGMQTFSKRVICGWAQSLWLMTELAALNFIQYKTGDKTFQPENLRQIRHRYNLKLHRDPPIQNVVLRKDGGTPRLEPGPGVTVRFL